ncbi:MAG: hypothetical protein IPO86_00130 [Saprospiraceae bacterium]|nr:hypothetical protein [Saprospiraceae bacterium]
MISRFIDLLHDQPNQNFGNKHSKINIHFPLRGEIANYCMQLNKEIQLITKSGVDFSPKSFQIPHLTLYMGFIANEKNYEAVLDEVYHFSQKMLPIKISSSIPYLKKPKRNYLFIDTEQSDYLIDLKLQLKEKVSKWIEPLNWDVVGETPHITVAYIRENFDAVEKLLENYRVGPDWIGDSFEISYGGPWGSCLGALRSFEFKG